MVLFLTAIFNSPYSLFTLFILVMASSIVIVPEIEVLVASFASFAINFNSLLFLIALVLIASVFGDLLTYSVAWTFSNALRKYLKKFRWYHKNEGRARSYLNKHGFLYIFLSRFLFTGLGLAINYLSGFEKLRPRKFISAVILGQLVAALLYSLIGYYFKDTWNELLVLVQYSFVVALLVALAVYLVIRLIKRRNKAK